MKNKYKISLFIILYTISFARSSAHHGNTLAKDKVNIIMNFWTSQNFHSFIYYHLLTRAAIPKQMVDSSMQSQWDLFSKKEVVVQTEIWQTTSSKIYENLMKKNLIVDGGKYSSRVREEWWYPSYVEKLCPGLPHWSALKKCHKTFRTNESDPLGHYYTGPWQNRDTLRVEALGLKFMVSNLRSQDELWRKLESAYKSKRPILILNWTPNFVDQIYKGKFVDFPRFDSKCYTDAKWGVNPYRTHDCGTLRSGWMRKIATKNIQKKFPCAFSILKNINFKNKEIGLISKQVQVDNIPLKRVAWNWMQKNQKRWKEWIPTKCIKLKGKKQSLTHLQENKIIH